jgi:hypothetical protein
MLLAFSNATKPNPVVAICRSIRLEAATSSNNFKKRTEELLQLLEEMKHDNQESVDRLKSEG